jgi:hypothetical protein
MCCDEIFIHERVFDTEKDPPFTSDHVYSHTCQEGRTGYGRQVGTEKVED